MTNTLLLSFSGAQTPQLDRVEYIAPSRQRHICTRGKDVGALAGSSTGTFQWTRAVKALSILALRTYLAPAADASVERTGSALVECTTLEAPTLEGPKGSLAAALDSALSKEPQWLIDIFGADKEGRAVARRIIKRTNAECKRPGPVILAFNSTALSRSNIKVFIENQTVEPRDAEALLNSILKDNDEPIASSQPLVRKTQPRPLHIIPMASPIVDDMALLPISITDLVLDIIEQDGPMSESALAKRGRDYLTQSLGGSVVTQVVSNLMKAKLLTQRDSYIDISPLARSRRNSLIDLSSKLGEGLNFKVAHNSARSITVHLSSPAEMDQLLAPLYPLCLQHTDQTQTTWWHLKHPLWPLMRPQAESRKADDFPQFKNTSYTCSGTSPVDKWVKTFYSKFGVAGHLNIPHIFQSDFWLIGDFFIGHWLPPELLRELSAFVNSCRDVSSFDNVQLDKAFFKNSERCSVEVLFAPGLTAWLRKNLIARVRGNSTAPFQIAA